MLVQLEDGHEGTLRNFDCADLAHALLSLLLLLEEFSLTRDVTSVTLRSNVLSHSLHSLAGDDFCSDCSLDRDIELLTRNQLLEKQKQGKKRMRQIGTVEVPQSAFMAVLKLD